MKAARSLLWISSLVAVLATPGCGAPPIDAVAKLKQVFAERPRVADADNAFLDVFGYTEAADTDAHSLGAQRAAWLEKFHVDPKRAGPDPGKRVLKMTDHRSQALSQVIDACRAAIARACGSALDRVRGDAPLSDIEPLLLARYEALLARNGWYEIGMTYPHAPLPSFDGVIESQRLTLIRLRNAAAAGDVEKVRATLGRDLAFWRRVLASSDTVFSKMVALAAIRLHFALGSYVLHDLPANRVLAAIPGLWREEFSDAERSMLRPMAGELVIVEELLGAGDESATRIFDREDVEDHLAPLDRLVDNLARRKSRQPRLSDVADYYLSAVDAFQAPLRDYETVAAKLHLKFVRGSLTWDVGEYALRVGSAEGMRRAALLTAELRSQSVPLAQLEERLKTSPLRNPYTGQPFNWDAADQAIVFTGPEPRKYKRQAYPY